MELDDTDREILRILQADARTPFSEVARRIDMSSATVHDRVNRMEEAGVIEGYHAKVDPGAVGIGAAAFVGLRIEQGRTEDALAEIRAIDEVQEIHLTTGEWDVILRVVAEDTDALRDLLFSNLRKVDGFDRSHTMVIVGTDYEATGLPL